MSSTIVQTDTCDIPLPHRSGEIGLLVNVHYSSPEIPEKQFVKLAKSLIRKHRKKIHSLCSVVAWVHPGERNVRVCMYENGEYTYLYDQQMSST
jgi:hypothetical protein